MQSFPRSAPRPALWTPRRRWLAGVACLVLVGRGGSQGEPGEVIYHQKINPSAGNLGVTLLANDSLGVVEAIGDLDGDGITDLAAGAPGDAGRLWILFLNRNGTVRDRVEIPRPTLVSSGEKFGASIAYLGELGGAPSIAVGAWLDEETGTDTGAVWVLRLDSGGNVLTSTRIANGGGGFAGSLASGDRFGDEVAAIGDQDSDGICDLAVGAFTDDTGGFDRGAVYILYLNADGTAKAPFVKIAHGLSGFGTGLTDGDQFGSGVCSLGDLGSGELTLAVGARGDFDNGVGSVWILFLDASEQVISKTKLNTLPGAPPAAGFFGKSVENAGNLDGLGATELVVGADHENNGGGAIFIIRLSVTGTTVSILGYVKVGQGSGNFTGGITPCTGSCPGPGDLFGYRISALGDLDLDGRLDLAVGAPLDGGSNQGAVWILFLNDGTIDLSSVTTWDGDSGNPDDWERGGNWSDGVPNSTDTVIVPDVAVAPVIRDGDSASCRHLIILPGASVTLGSAASSLAIHGGATLQGPISGPGAVNFQGAGTLSGTATLTAGLGITCNADISLQGGPLVVGAGTTLTVTQDLTIEAGAELECDGPVLLQSGGNGVLGGAGTLDCDGDLTLNLGSTTPPRIEVAGNLSVHSGISRFVPTSGTLVFDGASQTVSQLGGAIPIRLHDLELASTADVLFQQDLIVEGDTLWEGIGESTGSIHFEGNLATVPVLAAGAQGESRRTTPIVRAGDIYTARNVQAPSGILDPTTGLQIDTSAGVSVYVPNGVFGDVEVVGSGTANFESGDFTATGAFVIQGGTVVTDGDLNLTVQSLTITGTGVLDVQGNRIDLLGNPPVSVLNELRVAAGGELGLSASTVVVGNNGLLQLAGASENRAKILEADASMGGYEILIQSGGLLEAGEFLVRGPGPAGLKLVPGALLGSAPLDLRSGTFDVIAGSLGSVFLDIERSPGSPVELVDLRFQGGITGSFNVIVPPTSDRVLLTDWSGDFGGTTFEDMGGSDYAEWGTELLSLTCQETAAANVIRWNTGRRGEAEKYVLVRTPVAFPAPVELAPAGPPVGFQSYSHSDPSPGVAYNYQLFERFPVGALRLLGTVRSIPPRAAPPSPPAFVPFPTVVVPAQAGGGPVASPAGDFATVQEALAALPGEDTIPSLLLARGMHSTFEVSGRNVILRAESEAWIDVSSGPVRILALPAGGYVELEGLRFFGAAPGAPDLVVESCTGVVRLVNVQAGEILVDASRGVLLSEAELERLHVGPGARVLARGGSLAALRLDAGARLESFELGGEALQEGPGTWRAEARSPASLTFVGEHRLELRAPAGARAWILAAPRTEVGQSARGWPLLLDRRALSHHFVGLAPSSGVLTFSTPPASEALYLQALVLDPRTGEITLSDFVRDGS